MRPEHDGEGERLLDMWLEAADVPDEELDAELRREGVDPEVAGTRFARAASEAASRWRREEALERIRERVVGWIQSFLDGIVPELGARLDLGSARGEEEDRGEVELSPTQAAFERAVGFIANGYHQEARDVIESSLEEATGGAANRHRWTLAHAYLGLGEVERARAELEQVGGPFAQQAAALLGEIEEAGAPPGGR